MSNPFATPAASTPAATPAPAAETAPAATPEAAPAATAAVTTPSQATGETPTAPAGNLSAMFATGSKAGDGAKITADKGQAVVIRPTEYIPSMTTSHGETDAVRADWVVLTGPDAGQVREDSLIFQRVLVSTLKNLAGTATPFCVGVVGEGTAKAGKSAPIVLQDPTPEHLEYAGRAVQAVGWVSA